MVEYAEKMSSIKRRVVHEQVMAAARDRQVDVVVVWKLDRFARSLQQLLENMRLLDSYGVRFICVTQGIDTDRQNPASRLMLQIIGAVAEFERGLIAERVRSGMAEAKRQGKQLGRPRHVWRRDEAVQLRLTGLSFRQIAKRLGRPETTIRRAIQAAPQW